MTDSSIDTRSFPMVWPPASHHIVLFWQLDNQAWALGPQSNGIACGMFGECHLPQLLPGFIYLFYFIFINPIYRAEMATYVICTIGCRDLGSCNYTSSYCPILAATLAVCMSGSGLGGKWGGIWSTSTQGRADTAINICFHPFSLHFVYCSEHLISLLRFGPW